ncbi:hypothetical protein EV426DRAFT_296559 [Tirmania nivea]|nr:hypothetical protein EV426DRAFT_296559 [Tirmania nivea]
MKDGGQWYEIRMDSVSSFTSSKSFIGITGSAFAMWWPFDHFHRFSRTTLCYLVKVFACTFLSPCFLCTVFSLLQLYFLFFV